jgi:two-component system, OmpR family, response regulator CpxR
MLPASLSVPRQGGALLEMAWRGHPQPLRARLKCVRIPLPLTGGSSQEIMRPKKTILCVDDNEQALSVRKYMLGTRGYRVVGAMAPEEALELFTQGGIDLVLSDLHMPRMDGNELARRMKEISPDIPILLMSGSVNAFERATCGDCFLPKGACSPLDVLERVRMMLARKRGPKKAVHPPALRPNGNEQFEQQGGQGLPAFAS